MLDADPDMSVIRTQEMATDKQTEEQLSENKRNSKIKMETVTGLYQENSEATGFSSGSLYSLSESVSITMSDSENYAKNEVETNDNTDWDAADKEYMGIYSEEGCNGDMRRNHGMEVIDVPDSSEETDRFYLSKVLKFLFSRYKNWLVNVA